MMVICGSYSSSARWYFGLVAAPAGADGVQRRQIVVCRSQFVDQRRGVSVADHRHHADLLPLGGLPAPRAGRTCPVVVEHDRQAVAAVPRTRSTCPAACISGDTANHGWPAVADLVVDLGRRTSWSAPYHRRHVHVALAPQHALGPSRRSAGAHHDQIVRRSSAMSRSVSPWRQGVFQRDRSRQFAAAPLPSSTEIKQRQHRRVAARRRTWLRASGGR